MVMSITVAGLLLAATVHAADGEACRAMLQRTDGSPVRLVEDAGTPVVVFYEDRWSTALNQDLKDDLYARGKANGMLEQVRIVAVANIQQYDFFPARGIATAFIRGVESRVGVPILLDVRGTLSSPPMSLPADGGTVVLLDAGCRETFRYSGKLGSAERERFFAALEAAMGQPAGG